MLYLDCDRVTFATKFIAPGARESMIDDGVRDAALRLLMTKGGPAFPILKECLEIKESGAPERAERLLREASRIFYNDGSFYYERAVLAFIRSDIAEAKKLFAHCISIDQRHAAARRCLSLIYSIGNEFENVFELLENGHEVIENDSYILLISLSVYIASMKRRGLDLAEIIFGNGDHHWASWEQTEAAIRSALDNAAPFALVRFGDGEGSMATFGVEEEVENYQLYLQSRNRFVERWYGIPWRECADTMREIWSEIAGMLSTADVVGLPANAWIRHEFALGNAGLSCCLNARRLESRLTNETIVCRTSVHYDLLQFGAIKRILETVDRLTLISCHPNLGVELNIRFPRLEIDLVCVPPAWSDLAVTGYDFKRPAFQNYQKFLDNIDRPTPNSIVLVGAGFVGKWLTLKLKEAGHVVVDVGSVFDLLLGFESRPNFPKLTDVDWPASDESRDDQDMLLDEGLPDLAASP